MALLFFYCLIEVAAGAANLRRHIENIRRFGVPVIVALNAYPDDAASEVAAVQQVAADAGAVGTVVSHVFAHGGAGGTDLAQMVVAVAEANLASQPTFLYPAEAPIREKIAALATQIYGAAGVSYTTIADAAIDRFADAGFGALPICMAKTHLSLSHDPALKGAPSGFTFPIRDVRVSAGAGFIYPLAGDIVTMPGLPKRPAAHSIDIDEHGNTIGLY